MKKYFHTMPVLVKMMACVYNETPGIVLSAPHTWPWSVLTAISYYSHSPDDVIELEK